MSLDAAPLARLELPCRDLARQREFYTRVLGLAADGPAAFRLGPVRLVLRQRGDALFPAAGGRGAAPPPPRPPPPPAPPPGRAGGGGGGGPPPGPPGPAPPPRGGGGPF